MGWTRVPLAVMKDYGSAVAATSSLLSFDATGVSQHQIEFSRLMMIIFLNDELHKLSHNVMTFVGMVNQITILKLFIFV